MEIGKLGDAAGQRVGVLKLVVFLTVPVCWGVFCLMGLGVVVRGRDGGKDYWFWWWAWDGEVVWRGGGGERGEGDKARRYDPLDQIWAEQ